MNKLQQAARHNGLRLAACYSFWPNQLGFCGPRQISQRKTLLKYIREEKIPQDKIRAILEKFEAAYAYYKLIAKSNGIRDPFDIKVVKAYWIGNELLDKVRIENLRKMIAEDFSKPGLLPKEVAVKRAENIPEGSKLHHSFHVLILGPVTGRITLEGKLVDLCRISWGRVIDVLENEIKVISRPLLEKDGVLFLGNEMERGTGVKWDEKIVRLDKGDLISFHWNQVVGRITEGDAKNLERFTRYTLNLL